MAIIFVWGVGPVPALSNLVLRTNLAGPDGSKPKRIAWRIDQMRGKVQAALITDKKRRNVKLFNFGSEGIESVWIAIRPEESMLRPYAGKVREEAEWQNIIDLDRDPDELAKQEKEKAEKRALETEERAGRRAKVAVRRFSKHNKLQVMITMTFPGAGVHDYDDAYKHLSSWIKKFGRGILPGAYCAVPEPHPGGHGIHWHILVPSRLSRTGLAALRRTWTDHLGERGLHPTGGARYVRVHVADFSAWRDRSAVRQAAMYASKYVSKSMADGGCIPPGRHRYLISLDNSPKPLVFLRETVADWQELLANLFGVTPKTGWWFDSHTMPEWDKPFHCAIHIS
jgi:hypothetical protein